MVCRNLGRHEKVPRFKVTFCDALAELHRTFSGILFQLSVAKANSGVLDGVDIADTLKTTIKGGRALKIC